eukprot:CAMPEP_0170452470 /NCGR_PEP_ID=MMETSP0123-20130129/1358_1 /TAXON_ID=182087 /ORGANISM="Favella ehrenbergii, Strain Fehren 1" /LENGTH=61 /DNA_ID=CAMNT_0010714487 /DNA_START=334 /DNA_END=519 /DNA_ORIENTATION=-
MYLSVYFSSWVDWDPSTKYGPDDDPVVTSVCDLAYAISEDGKHVGRPIEGKGCDNITIDKD